MRADPLEPTLFPPASRPPLGRCPAAPAGWRADATRSAGRGPGGPWPACCPGVSHRDGLSGILPRSIAFTEPPAGRLNLAQFAKVQPHFNGLSAAAPGQRSASFRRTRHKKFPGSPRHFLLQPLALLGHSLRTYGELGENADDPNPRHPPIFFRLPETSADVQTLGPFLFRRHALLHDNRKYPPNERLP
jgi:hypothetical protein